MRSTNGVFLEQWQASERRLLIDSFKKRLQMRADAFDRDFFESIQKDPVLLKEFKEKNEFIAAASAGRLLAWMAKSGQNKDWLENTMGRYAELAGKKPPH